VQSAVVDVVVDEAQPAEASAEAGSEPESSLTADEAPREPEAAAEPREAEAIAGESVAVAGEAGPTPVQREPVAVGPGPGTPDAKPSMPAAPPEPAPITRLGPAKQPPKRPTRTISIFTRSWSGSGKKAASARQRDRS